MATLHKYGCEARMRAEGQVPTSHAHTYIHKLGLNHNYYTFPLILLIKIGMCGKNSHHSNPHS